MGLSRDFEKLSTFSKYKLRAAAVTDLLGSVVSDDLKKHPIKITPYFVIPFPILPTLTMGVIAATTVAMKARSENFRQQVADAFKKPVNTVFYENAMREDKNTGQPYVCSISMLKRRVRAMTDGSSYLTEYHLGRLPENKVTKFLKTAQIKLSRHPFPTVVDQPDQERLKGRWKGAVFALSSLANLEPSEIATHLEPMERQLFEQEYAFAAP